MIDDIDSIINLKCECVMCGRRAEFINKKTNEKLCRKCAESDVEAQGKR